MKERIYSGLDQIPIGRASDRITEGCLVLEGGAFRGVYGEGVLDAMMEGDINLSCTIGVSAGALNGVGYVSGQIGRSARINLRFRHDSRYVGREALQRNHGVIGFDFLFDGLDNIYPMDKERFLSPERRFVAVVTNCLTGKAEYMEKGKCSDIFQAVRASASMPYVSRMVDIDGVPYLDGGCACGIAFHWALEQDFEKIVVVRTRPRSFRKEIGQTTSRLAPLALYRRYPEFAEVLEHTNEIYNQDCNELERLESDGRLFVISPSYGMPITRLENDMERLGSLYWLGYSDGKRAIPALREYLNMEPAPALSAPAPALPDTLTPEQSDLLRRWARLSPEQKSLLNSLMEQMK